MGLAFWRGVFIEFKSLLADSEGNSGFLLKEILSVKLQADLYLSFQYPVRSYISLVRNGKASGLDFLQPQNSSRNSLIGGFQYETKLLI